MTGIMKNVAVSAANKGHPASFYAPDKTNPVLQALDQEIHLYVTYMRKYSGTGFQQPEGEASSRPSDMLFDLWNKFESRLPLDLYQRKLVEMGDFLASIKVYDIALRQCYGRYLSHFSDTSSEDIDSTEVFTETYFADGFENETAGYTFRSLMGNCICTYQLVCQQDPKFQNAESVGRCIHLLAFLRLVTQVILPKESLCWLVYNGSIKLTQQVGEWKHCLPEFKPTIKRTIINPFNGTIHIYSISRRLMSLGHSAKVLEFLLWASSCMEFSVPLLGVRYLSWRTTLYVAVCHCYYDCKHGHYAEAFARNALAKIQELSQLENVSNASEDAATEAAFREATIKMGTMIYRRTVFETRRKPKGLLRPKTRANLKEAQQLPWPRTASERSLVEMMEGSAAQMLCIIETLSDTNRRTLLTQPPAAENEVEILDVYAELFMAAQEIIAGGGGYHGGSKDHSELSQLKVSGMAGVVKEQKLMDLSIKGEDGVPLSTVVKLTKLAYCYEQWEFYDNIIENVISAIKELNDPYYGPDLKALDLLKAYDKVMPRSRQRRTMFNDDDSDADNVNQTVPQGTAKGYDDLIHLAEVLKDIITGPYKQEELAMDMIVDTVLSLWSKCKAVFQRHQTGSAENWKYLNKIENPTKWVYILDITHQVLGWCGVSAVDPALTAEVALRLSLVFEACTAMDSPTTGDKIKSRLLTTQVSKSDSAAGYSRSKDMDEDQSLASASREINPHVASVSELSHGSSQGASSATAGISAILTTSPLEQLTQARDILQLGLNNINYACQAVALTDGRSIADVGWSRQINSDLFKPLDPEDLDVVGKMTTVFEDDESFVDDGSVTEASSVWNLIQDLHLELTVMYHRVSVKMSALQAAKKEQRSITQRLPKKHDPKHTFEKQIDACFDNQLSKALLYMQQVYMLGTGSKATAEQNKLLMESLVLIQKVQQEEMHLFYDNPTEIDIENVSATKVPKAPILLSRTDSSMVFRPAPFKPASNQKIAWYRIFCRSASGSNVKVRMNDYFLPGTGDQIPAHNAKLRVSGLTGGRKYMFAVAAYTIDGQLIGNSVGKSTKPILASATLPILMAWAYLSQVSYQVGSHDICQQACSVLWSHFVVDPPPPQKVTYVISNERDFVLALHRLNPQVVTLASPMLLRMFLVSLFIQVDVNVVDGNLFCNTLCDEGPLNDSQLKRLNQAERLLVALELSGWLNEYSLALQAVVQCYGLVSPLIHWKIPAVPLFQILERCHAVLQEIPANIRQRRPAHTTESLHHMTACLTYHIAKVLRTWGQRALAAGINDTGRKLLTVEVPAIAQQTVVPPKGAQTEAPQNESSSAPEKARDSAQGSGSDDDEVATKAAVPEPNTETGSLTLAALKKKKGKGGPLASGKDEEQVGNEELKALEAHMLRLSKQAQSDHELAGNEDINILHAYIAYLPSKLAYKEVSKFKRRQRYLEFFVQVAQKAISDGISDSALEWCEDALQWINKRNEGILGAKLAMMKEAGVTTVKGADGMDKGKFTAAMVEYNKQDKEKGSKGMAKFAKEVKKKKYKPVAVDPTMTDAQRQAQEDAEIRALRILSLNFLEMINTHSRQRRFRKVCSDEAPWRSQLSMVQALSQFAVFQQKLEFREKLLGLNNNHVYRTSFLDQEWFSFETSGTLVVGWEGGPSRQLTRQEPLRPGVNKGHLIPGSVASKERDIRSTGIEIAAAAATGKPVPSTNLPIKDGMETPRTFKSEPYGFKSKHQKEDNAESALLSPSDAEEMLYKAFTFFNKAMVLAHRGQHWTLLQNACRGLWNCTHTALMRTYSLTGESGAAQNNAVLSVETLRKLAWRPFYVASDCLLDMLHQMQGSLNTDKSNKQTVVATQASWSGNIRDEKGGSSLTFEAPLDDMSTVDIHWIRRIIMRTIEMLHYELRYEKLVDVALRFNALTDDRYTEHVNPLLVHAQRKLSQRCQEYGGQSHPQAHFQMAFNNLLLNKQIPRKEQHITAKSYLDLQLQVDKDQTNRTKLNPAAHIDPSQFDLYSGKDKRKGGVHAMRLCCVPLDVTYSLKAMRETLDQSNYTSRALQHSRRLLVLYLAGQQNDYFKVLSKLQACASSSGSALNPMNPIAERSQSHVDFVPTTAKPEPAMPPDLKQETYDSVDDIQTATLPRSQITVVLSSYDKTIELLLANNQNELATEAMRELGNLHYHAGNIRGAYKWWLESLDLLLGGKNVIHKWRQLLSRSPDISATLLQKCGLWGCILGAVLAANIAQYVLTSNLGMKLECCFLSGYFFKALFCASQPHPKADSDYALYEIGEGCEVLNLIPGIDLLSDRYRIDGRTLVASLRFIMDDLTRAKHNLFVLPLLSLYQYITTHICRDLQRSVEGRILRVRVLTDLSLFSEALVTLLRLLHGERLPHTGDTVFRQVESRMTSTRFNSAKPLLEPCNLKILDAVLEKRLSSNLSALYGPHLTCHLSLVQSHVIVAVANTVHVLPVFDDVPRPGSTAYYPQPQTISTISKPPGKGPSISSTSRMSKVRVRMDDEPTNEADINSTVRISKRLTNTEKPVDYGVLKGTLLSMADQIVSTLSDIITENAQNDKGLNSLSSSELEVVVLCKLEQASIATQRQHATLSARLIMSALKLIQISDVYNEQKDESHRKRFSHVEAKNKLPSVRLVQTDSAQYQYQNAQSRARLDARLWLITKTALVASLLGEIKGMGLVKGTQRRVKLELAEARQYCAECIGEAEACGDSEIHAQLLMYGLQLDLMEGSPVKTSIATTHEIEDLLRKVNQPSEFSLLLTTKVLMHRGDLETATSGNASVNDIVSGSITQYCSVQDHLLCQIREYGQKIEHHYPMPSGDCDELSTPTAPLKNLYLPHLLPLVQLKLRIGHAMARRVTCQINDNTLSNNVAANLFARPLGVLQTALELCRVIGERVANIETEILFNISKIQRQLYLLGFCTVAEVHTTLIETIKVSYANDHDLGIIHQSYMELALLYLNITGSNLLPPPPPPDQDGEDGSKQADDKPRKKRTKSKNKSSKSKTNLSVEEDMQEQAYQVALAALRSATQVGQAQRARVLLMGEHAITSQPIAKQAQAVIPEFTMVDLVGSYVLGEKKRVYKNEIEEELAPLTEALEPPQSDTYEDKLNRAREATEGLSWIHILGYQVMLQRYSSTFTLTSISKKTSEDNQDQEEPSTQLGPEFDLGFISHTKSCSSAIAQNVVRSVIFSPNWMLRLNYMHDFLAQNLPSYKQDCVAIYPSAVLLNIRSQPVEPVLGEGNAKGLDIISKSYQGNMTIPLDIHPDATETPKILAPASQETPYMPSDKTFINPLDNEVCLTWYNPSLDLVPTEQPDTEQKVVLGYAANKRTKRETACGFISVSLPGLYDLHDRLSVMIQRGEISLADTKAKKEAVAGSVAKSKKATRIKALSPKAKRDEQLEALLVQCLQDVYKLLGITYDDEELSLTEEGKQTTDANQPTNEFGQSIPFEVTKQNLYHLEKLFDPSYGHCIKVDKDPKILRWMMKIFTAPRPPPPATSDA